MDEDEADGSKETKVHRQTRGDETTGMIKYIHSILVVLVQTIDLFQFQWGQ